jgi:hypothetical protein
MSTIPKFPMPSPRTLLLIGALALFGFLAWAGPTACQAWRDRAAQERLNQEQGNAASASGKDAVETTANAGQREADSEALTRENQRDILAAPGAGERVNSGVDVAGRRALCRRPAYAKDPRCEMFRKEGR